MSVTATVLEAYMEKYGWSFEATNADHWKTGFNDGDHVFGLNIRLSSTFLLFEISPLIDIDIEWDLWPEVLVELLEINDQLPILKVSLSSEGKVILTAESLTSGFDYDCFCNIVGILGEHASSIRLKLFEILHLDDMSLYKEPRYFS